MYRQIIIATLMSVSIFTAQSSENRSYTFPLDKVVTAVKKEIEVSQSVVIGEPRFDLTNVKLELSISDSTEKGGDIRIGVPALKADLSGGKTNKEHSASHLAVELEPPKPITLSSGTELKEFKLARYIIETRKQLQKGLKDPPYLEPKQFVISTEFGIVAKDSVGADLNFLVISIGGNYAHLTGSNNKIILTFERSKMP